MAQIFASRLRGMNVLTDRGLQIGRLHDILVDEETGRILSLVVRPTSKGMLENLPSDESGNALLPFSSVMAMRDYIVINERVLVIHQLKKAPPLKPVVGPAPAPEAPPAEQAPPPSEPQLL